MGRRRIAYARGCGAAGSESILVSGFAAVGLALLSERPIHLFLFRVFSRVSRILLFRKWERLFRGGAEEFGDFALHALDLVQAEAGVGHDKHVAGGAVLVNQNPATGAAGIGLDLF